MRDPGVPPQPFFAAIGLDAIEIGAAELPRLQAFFDASPGYFIAVHGEPAGPAEAHEEVFGELPAGWPYTKRWVIGLAPSDVAGAPFVAMASVVADLPAPGVWHVGLFMVAPAAHGQGTAQAVLGRLEAWARAAGAGWLRLGVVAGNARAERFWERSGFVELRRREGLRMGRKLNTVRVMAKPLADGRLADYLALVARDDPRAH
jgi:GNAT superfamily N-acetyltransferase